MKEQLHVGEKSQPIKITYFYIFKGFLLDFQEQ